MRRLELSEHCRGRIAERGIPERLVRWIAARGRFAWYSANGSVTRVAPAGAVFATVDGRRKLIVTCFVDDMRERRASR